MATDEEVYRAQRDLKSDDPETRIAALQLLGRDGRPSIFWGVREALKDAKIEVHDEASHALVQIRDRRIEELSDPDFWVRSKAIWELTHMCTTDPWIKSFLGIETANVGGDEALNALIARLDPAIETEIFTRCQVINALKEIGDTRSIEPLLRSLNPKYEPEWSVRSMAADALGWFNYSSWLQAIRVVKSLLRTLAREKEAPLSADAADSLGNIRHPLAAPALISRVNWRREHRASVRSSSALALGKVEIKPGFWKWIAVRALTGALRDEDAGVREYAALSLGNIGDAKPVKHLMRMLDPKKEPNGRVRSLVASSLGKLGDERAVDALRRTAGVDTDYFTRVEAQRALVSILEASALRADEDSRSRSRFFGKAAGAVRAVLAVQ